MLLAENTANACQGRYMNKRYAEITGEARQDTRTGEEIARDIIQRAGLVVIKNESI